MLPPPAPLSGGSSSPSPTHARPAAPPGPPSPPSPQNYACATRTFDASSWRSLSVPHDWSIEDLPSREDDSEFPVLGIRYGQWKLRAGDNITYAAPSFPDDGWMSATGGSDWREYGKAFEAINATGWYRQHLVVPPSLANSTVNLTLSLGIVAGSSTTYLNGQLLGSSNGAPLPNVRDYITPVVRFALPRPPSFPPVTFPLP